MWNPQVMKDWMELLVGILIRGSINNNILESGSSLWKKSVWSRQKLKMKISSDVAAGVSILVHGRHLFIFSLYFHTVTVTALLGASLLSTNISHKGSVSWANHPPNTQLSNIIKECWNFSFQNFISMFVIHNNIMWCWYITDIIFYPFNDPQLFSSWVLQSSELSLEILVMALVPPWPHWDEYKARPWVENVVMEQKAQSLRANQGSISQGSKGEACISPFESVLWPSLGPLSLWWPQMICGL